MVSQRFWLVRLARSCCGTWLSVLFASVEHVPGLRLACSRIVWGSRGYGSLQLATVIFETSLTWLTFGERGFCQGGETYYCLSFLVFWIIGPLLLYANGLKHHALTTFTASLPSQSSVSTYQQWLAPLAFSPQGCLECSAWQLFPLATASTLSSTHVPYLSECAMTRHHW